MNDITIIGNLVKDPEGRDYGFGKVVILRIASEQNYSKKVNYFHCQIVEKDKNVQDFAMKYLKKGNLVAVSGTINFWKSTRGDIETTGTTVQIHKICGIGKPATPLDSEEESNSSQPQGQSPRQAPKPRIDASEEIPKVGDDYIMDTW